MLPPSFYEDASAELIKVKTLLTDENIRKAMLQVQEYCVNTGCEHACITNGHQWIFFKTFERHNDWRNLHAFVVPTLAYFRDQFTETVNILGYTAVIEKASLPEFVRVASASMLGP